MTEQQRLTIRAELARRMGYSVVQSPYEEFRFYRLVSPNGERSGLCESETEAWSLAPDPFTNAADNRELVLWLAKQSSEVQQEFEMILMSDLATEENCKLPVVLFWLTASPEAITLATAKALGIGEAESD